MTKERSLSKYFHLLCSKDTYGQYAELRHTAEVTLPEGLPTADDMKAERDYMDTVCRSFATRLERRRTLLITSVRFHRFAEDVSHLPLLHFFVVFVFM